MAKVCIPKMLEKYCGNRSELVIAGDRLNKVLKVLETEHPKLFRSICDETGQLRPHVNLFINDQMIPDRTDFKISLDESDVVNVFQAVSGG